MEWDVGVGVGQGKVMGWRWGRAWGETWGMVWRVLRDIEVGVGRAEGQGMG